MGKFNYLRFTRLLLSLLFLNLIIQQYSSAQCPVIQFQDLRGTIGFPQFDNTSQCGDPDTLSVLVFTDAPGEILGFDITVNLVDGLVYGGISDTQFGGNTTISYAGGSPTSPEFSLGGVTDPDDVMVMNIGLVPNCDLDLDELYKISFEYEYVYEDEDGNIIDCDGTFDIDQEFNSGLKRPELNMGAVSPSTRVLTTLGTPFCQTMVVSQDGLQANLGEMDFSVCNFTTVNPNVGISSIRANNIDLPFTIENDSTVSALVDGSYFLTNSSPNPTDTKFNTGEKITFKVCYQSDFCPDQSTFNPVYKASFGCDGETCNITSQTATVKIQPNTAADPIATASFSGPVEICGDAGTISLSVTNPGASGFENTYTDLSIGYETCEETNLGIGEVRVAGVVLTERDYDWIGDDLTIHFDSLDMIPGSNLIDADGDGFYDDLPGGATVSLEIDMEIMCGIMEVDPTSLDCPTINCSFATFFVQAKSNCGNTFNKFPAVDEFDINYGPTAVANNNEVNIGSDTNPVLGYDFGIHGSTSSTSVLPPATIDYEFCYEFDSDNVSPCPSGAQYGLKLSFAGDPRIVQDYEVVPGSIYYSADGGADISVPDMNATFMTPDPSDPGQRMLMIDGGAANDMVCYKMQMQLDTAFCSAALVVAVSQQVTEYCPDCDCTVVKACKNTQFKSDPSYYYCPCIMGHNIEVTRKNLGYTDYTMSTKVDRQTILDNCPADLINFGPGDTMAVCVAFDIKDIAAVTDMNMWGLSAGIVSTSGYQNTEDLPLTPDRRAGGIVKWEVIQSGGSPVEFSFADFPGCDSRTGNTYSTNDERNGNEIQQGYPAYVDYGLQDLTTEFDVSNTYPANSSNDGYDNTINSTLYIRNATQSNECGSITYSSGGNCLQEFLDEFDFQVGDTIKMYVEYPMKRNPYRAAAIAAGENPPINNSMSLNFNLTMYNYDEFGSPSYCYTYNSRSCNAYPIVNVADYGGVTAITDLELDNCGGQAKHTFTVTKNPPTGWYNCEFRPIANIDDVDLPMFGPFAYCSNANVIDRDDSVTPISVDSTTNATCAEVASVSGEVCITEDPALGDGKVVVDLTSQGIRPLGVGLDNNDTLCLAYDLCSLCPTPFTIDYELIYDWSDICDMPRDPQGYICNTTGPNGIYSYCDQLGFNRNWYTDGEFDTLMYKLDESSVNFIVTDNRVPNAGMSTVNNGPELIAAGSPGVSVEYQEIELCNADDVATQMNVQGSVQVPSSVSFVGAYSTPDGSGTPLTTSLVSDNGTTKTYSITPLSNSLAPMECETIYIGTTLLYCPVAPALPPQICVAAISGCAPPDIAVALGGGGTCGGSQVCYAYTVGEAGVQTEWYNTPTNAELCQTDTFYIRVKNTKVLTLVNLETSIANVPGLMIDPTSWAVAYPGGSVGFNGTFGNIQGDGTAQTIDAAFMPVTAPTLNGDTYSWADDADWAPYVDTYGLPGVFSMADSNNISIRFIGTTDCDNFLSGAKMQTETTVTDPCGPSVIGTGLVDTEPIIINGADPVDNAQVLVTTNPSDSYCTESAQAFGITALNISEKSTSDIVETCVTIPTSALTYEANSIVFTSPSYTPNSIVESVEGDNVIVCFDSPPLNPGQKFSFQFMATQPLEAVCGPILLGVDVKSFEEAVACASAPGMTCGVYVQNSINPGLVIQNGPPLRTDDIRLNRQCSMGINPEQFCYEIDLYNPGEFTYQGDIRVGIHDDVLDNGVYDEIVDEELAGFDHSSVSVDPGQTVTINMCLEVPTAQSCPILIKQTYESACACDATVLPYDNIPPAFLDTLESVVLCPGTPFTTDICGDYEFTLEPAEGGTIQSDGSSLTVTLNMGYGVDDPVVLKAVESIGDCTSEAELEFRSAGDYMPVDLAFQVCEGECIDPDLLIPDNVSEGSQIEITQSGAATMGNDLDMIDPEICGLTPGMTDTYTVTITSSPTCIFTFDFTVEVLPVGVLTMVDEEVCNHPIYGGTLEAMAGFDNYQFFLVLPNGTEVLKSSGANNTYNTSVSGDYVIKATSTANDCPSVATASISSDHCVDLALIKEIESIVPGPYPTSGGTVEYKLTVINQGGVEMNQIELTDYVPAGLTNNDPNWTPTGTSDGIVTRVVSTPGFGAGDEVEVSIVLTVNEGATFENTTNIAEISAMQDVDNNDVSGDDIDSTPDTDPTNDPGGNPDTASDNVVDGDGTNGGGANGDEDPTTDEDDNDPATLPIFDLALTKMVDPTSIPASGMFTVGDPIIFFITVMNQGSVDATDVVITDLIPCGMEMFDEADPINMAQGWTPEVASTESSSGFETQKTISSLPAGSTVQVPIKMTLAAPTGGTGHNACAAGMDSYLNFGYIDSALDGMGNPTVDVDSEAGSFTVEEEGVMPNTNGDNDVTSTSNAGDGSQDDSDPANIEIFDLALSKILNPDNGPYAYGDVATFEICVTNQGNVPSDDIQIVDYIPAGYIFDPSNDPKWTDNGDGTAIYDADVSDFAGNTVAGQIGFLEQVCVDIKLIVQAADASDPTAYVNTAEIAGANTVTDPDGSGPGLPVSTPVTADNDGPFDTDMTNDAGGAHDTSSDAMTSDPLDPGIQGNGLGEPGDEDPATDSDDSDIASIDIVDFALTKQIVSPDAPFSYGDTITYNITVHNQGTVSGMNITITDYAPAGLEYIASPLVNPGWTGGSAYQMYMINNVIEPGDSTVVPIKMIVTADGTTAADYTNIAEIFSVIGEGGVHITNDDVDSQPDSDPLNDAGGAANTDSDDAIDGDGSGANGDEDPATDEDDNDPAFVQIFDLAQTKEVVGGPYTIGDLVEYKITTINQGNAAVTNVVVNDYVPAGLEFSMADNPDWGFVGANPTGNTVSTTITDVVEPGQMVMTSLFLKVLPSTGDANAYTNYTEISSFEDTNGNSSTDDPTIADSDSTPDDDPTNDAGGNPDTDSDDSVDGTGTGDPLDEDANTDEDDQDPAMLSIPDLALTKTTSQTGPFSYGDIVTFDITVINQGNVVASNVEVVDYIPNGFIYQTSNDASWSYDGTVATTTVAGPLNSGDMVVVSIDLMVTQSSDPADAYTNEAEISEAFEEDGTTPFEDVDSEADSDNTNDAGGSPMTDSDNSVDGNGTNGDGTPDDANAATDEDDADPELIEIVDVAQTKTLVSEGPFSYGDSLEFNITTYNQGNVTLKDIVITDYIPAGFSLSVSSEENGWALSGAGAEFTITDELLPGDSVETPILLILGMTTGGEDDYTNVSEVSMMYNTDGDDVSDDDADSNINDDPTDNGGGAPNTDSDDSIDGDGTGAPGDEDGGTDEDNSDPAFVEILDLAVIMENSDDMITMYGQDITFPISLANQGNVASDMPEVTVTVPDGFVFDPVSNPGWVDNGDGTVTYTYPAILAPGDLEMFDLVLTSQPGTDSDSWTPVVAITEDNPVSDTPGLTDIDSDTDGDTTNDAGGNALPDTGDNPDGTIGSDDSLTGDGSGDPDDTDAATDSDASDPEFVRIVDVAQTKQLVTEGPYEYGQLLEFEVTTYNQGNVPLTDVEIIDYIPAGFAYDASSDAEGWAEGADGNATITLAGPIVIGTPVVTKIYMTLEMTTGGEDNYTNVSEVTMMSDDTGMDVTDDDVDSELNDDPTDNGGGAPNTDSDDSIDGDGTGAPGDEDGDTDEDSSDPAFLEVVDLALSKIISPDETTPFAYGDTLTFNIIVTNQGNIDANNILVTDFVPVGYDYADSSADTWIGGTTGPVNVTNMITDTLLAGETTTLAIDLIVKAVSPTSTSGDWTNIAEITSMEDVDGNDITENDIDSDADTDPNNDAGSNPSDGTNDVTDGDGTGTPNDGNAETDEDDNDPEIIEVFDLALTKQTMTVTGMAFGDTVQYMITVENQGNVPATNVEVTDFYPCGLAYIASLNDPLDWTDNGATATTTIADTIYAGETVNLIYYLEIQQCNEADAFVNYAEISMAQDTLGNSTDGTGPDGGITDIDSTPDDIQDNDAGGEPGSEADNESDGDGSGEVGDGIAGTDEDDSDPALIEVIDVALTKKVADGQGPFAYGTPVLFDIEVENQGNVPLTEVEVTDYIPVGYVYDAATSDALGWTYDGTNATQVIPGPMVMWDVVTLQISLIPIAQVPSTDPTAWTNVAEVSQILDEDGNDISDQDIDSQSDNDSDNDPGGEPGTDSDDTTDGDGNNGGGAPGDTDADSDEDDSDPAMLPIFDLALTKQLLYPDSLYKFGDEMEFIITLDNQGNVPSTNIEITEYVPAALTEVGATNDPLWMFNGAVATYVYEDTLQAGTADTVYLNMIFQQGAAAEDYVNYAEISEAADTLGNNTTDNPDVISDADSTPDDDNTNDAGGTPDGESDDSIDGDGSGQPGDDVATTDEDDHDPTQLGFVDMALVKRLVTTGPVAVNQDVTFEIEVINQGTFTMVDIAVIDYIPDGFLLSTNDTNGWTTDADGNAVNTVEGPVAFDESEILEIVLTVQPNANADNLVNIAELTEFFFDFGDEATEFDIDSEADADSDNDAGGMIYTDSDDAENGDGSGAPGDEDPDTDEDDQDPAAPDVLDLSLVKTTDHTTAVRPGDIVTFNIEVCNQGNIAVDNVVIEDYIPAGMILSATDANGWIEVDGFTISNSITERLEREACMVVNVDMEILPNFTVSDMVNVAEITEVYDTLGNDVSAFDIDSTPGDDNGEAEGTIYGSDDNSASGSVPNGEDSDDADPAAPPVFDLAIRKTNPVVGPSSRGDVIPFEITVFNQGNMIARDILVTDYIPEGLEFVADGSNDEWILAGTEATTTVGELLAFADTTIVINLEILQTATPMNVVNMSEISSAVDTFGVNYSGMGNDYDSDYDGDNTNDEGNEIYDLENNDVTDGHAITNAGPTGMDEDDHDQAWALLCDGISCEGSLNVSLDENCMTTLTPSMFLTGNNFPDHIYELEIKDEDGNIHPNMFDGSDVGKSFTVSVINPLCGNNSCWMTVHLEDKLAPEIICEDVTISCNGVGLIPTPEVVDICGNVDVILINEIKTNIDCDDDYIGMIQRTYIAKDSAGNESEPCTQTIMLQRVTVGSIVAPASFILPSNSLTCGSGYATDENGMPHTSVTGVPSTVDGIPLFPLDNSVFCSGFSEYEDQVLSSDGCLTKIMRKFTIGEWHCSSTNEVFIFQMIDIVDDQAPTVIAPNDMTVSTATFSCNASVPLPAATVADQCNEVTVDIAYPGGFIDNQNGGLIVLPAGEHLVTYTVYDACLNSASATMTVTVLDQADPIALCDGSDVVSIGTGNTASLTAVALDDGSFDECGDVTLSVARMDDPGFDDGSAFDEAVEFSCTDIGQNIMVALLVTDMGGNTNMCMVQVEVQDKIDAFISCPGDITVDCTTAYDLNDLSAFGVPVITDNCTTTDYTEDVSTDFNQCGVGTITRVFTVNDAAARTCTQVITFENQNEPFTEDDITWPSDYIAPNGCIEANLSPAGLNEIDPEYGFPVVVDFTTCILTGSNFVDEEFIGGGGACRTIYRTWTIIDWCETNPDGSYPTYDHTQVIEVNNVTAPTFSSSTEAITVESYAADCIAPVQVDGLVALASDDCTPEAQLSYTFAIDIDNDGIDNIAGIGTDASGTYPLGTHSVRFTVTDGCGNFATQQRLFTVVNLKTATPYCLDNISVQLTPWDNDGDGIPDTEMATITPDLIDAGSFHSCGYDIQLSFSADVNDTVLIVDCSDIGDLDLELWVTDENGNADFCTTTIDVQDNNDVEICSPSDTMVSVEGIIYTELSEEVNAVRVGLIGEDVAYDNTEEVGEYAFTNMPTGGDYMVIPSKNDNHSNGVSTLDLVLIQRHILGLGDLDSPYKMIAADINNNQSISAADIVILRKLILGVYEEFPTNNSWRFVDADFDFPDVTDPWLSSIPEDYEILNLNSNMNIDFVGVKTGDVNGSVTANAQSVSTETRSGNTWTIAIDDKQVKVGEIVTVEVKSTDISKVYGWQYSLDARELSLINVTAAKANMSAQNIYDENGTIHISFAEANGLDVLADEVLYTITLQAKRTGKLSKMINITDRGLKAESYHTDMNINDIAIKWNEAVKAPIVVEEFSVDQNEPNPWYDRTSVSYYIPYDGDVKFIVKDVAGRTLYNVSAYHKAGKHSKEIESRLLKANGVLFYEVHYGDQIISNKMIHIE